jgi:hypothetical protein
VCARSTYLRKRENENLPAVTAVPAITTTIAAAVAAAATASPTAITTAAAATTTAVTAPPTTTTGAFGLRTRFVHNQVPAPEVLTIETGNSAIGVFIVGDFDEGEATRLSREAISDQTDCGGIHTNLPKPFLQLLFRSVERKITHVKLLHQRTPSARNLTTIAERTEESKPPTQQTRGRAEEGGGTFSVVPCMVSKIDWFCNNKSRREGWREVLGRGLAPNWHGDTQRGMKNILNLRKYRSPDFKCGTKH